MATATGGRIVTVTVIGPLEESAEACFGIHKLIIESGQYDQERMSVQSVGIMETVLFCITMVQ